MATIDIRKEVTYIEKNAENLDQKTSQILKLGRNINSAKLSDDQKQKIEKAVKEAYDRLKKLEESKPAPKTSEKISTRAKNISSKQNISYQEALEKAREESKERKESDIQRVKSKAAILKQFKTRVGSKAYERAIRKTNVPQDMEIQALKSGKRYPKQGKTSNQYGTFANKPQRPYWESRANRMDINQSQKPAIKYPKLAKGGETTMPIQVVIDGDWDEPKYFKTFSSAKLYVMKNYKKHDLEIIDHYGDSIFVEKGSTQKDLDFLFSHEKFAEGGRFGANRVMTYREAYSTARAMGIDFDKPYDEQTTNRQTNLLCMYAMVGLADRSGWQKATNSGTGRTFFSYLKEKHKKNQFADGGEVAKSNKQMVLSKAKEVKHHADELQHALKNEKDIEAWVVSKVQRASTDLSDVTHYLDGRSEYGNGGKIAKNNYVAVSEAKDGTWFIISKPSTRTQAKKVIDLGGFPQGEKQKVVTIAEAKKHTKVIGKEYLALGGTLQGDLNVDNVGFGIKK